MATAVDSIEVPSEFVELAGQWYEGQGDILYAVASTGGLTLGNRRPLNDDDEPMSDQEWYVHLFDDLDCSLFHLLRRHIKSDHEDFAELQRFQKWAEDTADKLRSEYGLE